MPPCSHEGRVINDAQQTRWAFRCRRRDRTLAPDASRLGWRGVALARSIRNTREGSIAFCLARWAIQKRPRISPRRSGSRPCGRWTLHGTSKASSVGCIGWRARRWPITGGRTISGARAMCATRTPHPMVDTGPDEGSTSELDAHKKRGSSPWHSPPAGTLPLYE